MCVKSDAGVEIGPKVTSGRHPVRDEQDQASIVASTIPPTDRHLLPEDVDGVVSSVQGWLGPREGRLLYRLAAEADPSGCIVEIGSWHGRSTIWLTAGAKAGRGARVFAIDPHAGTHLRPEGETTERVLRANLERAGTDDQVEILVATSEEAAADWSRPISLLWIDGDHEYGSVRRDLDLWEPHLLPDAAVALHDTFVWPGPERVVHERLIKTGRFTSFLHAETTTAARRCERLRPMGALARRAGLVRRSLYGVRLRAYDANSHGFARIRDALVRR